MGTKINPPNWPIRLLEILCRVDLRDEIIGDLQEAFQWRLATEKTSKARVKFIYESLLSLKPQNLKTFHVLSINTMIFQNYFKVVSRNLLRRKTSSFINIVGLSLGITAFLLIFLYTFQIFSFDGIHTNKERIYLVYKERITPDGVQPTYDTWVPMANRLKKDFPAVKSASSIYTADSKVIKNEQFIDEDIIYADQDFFDLFSYPLVRGQNSDVLPEMKSLALSKSYAYKYFGDTDPIGQSVDIFLQEEDTTLTFQVSAIIGDFPENTSIQPHMVIRMDGLPFYPDVKENWGSSFLETFVLLDERSNMNQLEAQFPELIEQIWDHKVRENTRFKLLPFVSYYDTFLGSKKDARTLLLIAIGILFIAAINFTNLSVANAAHRLREIGVRKVLGAFKGQVRTQFLFEALITSFISIALAWLFVILITPFFNEYFDLTISLWVMGVWELIAMSFAMTLLIGLLSGIYPALYLSSLRSLDAIQKKVTLGGRNGLRNTLVVVQFAIALFLITSTLLIREQISFMMDSDMGFSGENTLVIRASPASFTNSEVGAGKLKTFREELKRLSYVEDASLSRTYPTQWTRSFTFVRPAGWTGDPLRMRYTYMDANFLSMYEIPLISGGYFLPDLEGNQRESVILNKAAMEAFGFEPYGEHYIEIGNNKIRVVGITENFNYETLAEEVHPTLMFHRTADNLAHRFISLKLETSNLNPKIEEMEAMWNQLGAIDEFSFQFLDERVTQLYEAEDRYMGLVATFSVIAIVVACMGLYVLSLFVIENRQKELSVRKVLGAETREILIIIIRSFTKWVLIAFIISIPLVIVFFMGWVETFFNQAPLSWVTFLMTILLVLGLVLFTVGYQSLKVAIANPVKYLKDE